MDISTLANLINAVAVTAGVIFAATQIRDYRRQRRRDSMLALVRSFQSPTFAKALRSVIELPDNANAEKIRGTDRKSTRLNSSHRCISYAVFCLKKKI